MLKEIVRSHRRVESAATASAKQRSASPARHRTFHKPVRVQRRRVDRDRVIIATRIALDTLQNEWVKPESARREKAIRACLKVIRGEKPPSFARNALIAAAEEAGVLLES